MPEQKQNTGSQNAWDLQMQKLQNRIPGLQAALFDLDGTLLDSMPYWDTLAADYLHSRGIVDLPEDLDEILSAMSTRESAVWIKETFGLPEEAETLEKQVLDFMSESYRSHIPLKEGIRPVLQLLNDHQIPMAVVTASDADLCRQALKRTGVLSYFQKILTCAELKTSKREPLIYEKGAEALHAQPGHTLVFEDVLFAMQSAKQDGFQICAVADEAAKADENRIRQICDLYWNPDDLPTQTETERKTF